MDTLKVISHNVKGLHNPIKRKKILHQLKQANCQIAYLQETHLPDGEHEKFKKVMGRQSILLLAPLWKK